MSSAWREGVHYHRRANVEQSGAIVDGRAYYRAFYRAALEAERYLMLAGWQFDSEVALLRGTDAEGAPLPVTLVSFLSALCDRRPELEIYMLAWDFSLVYALEREWLQRLRFGAATPKGLRFEFDTHPLTGGSHHQKFVVIDGQLGFVGSLDICDVRWDDREHAPGNPLRINIAGEPVRANHEVQAAVVGEAAQELAELFRARWKNACGETLAVPPPPQAPASRFDLRALTAGELFPLGASEVWLSRTSVAADVPISCEIRSAYADALRAAERFVYLETQYFTSRSITAALLERLRDRSAPKLSIAVVLPRAADSTKEHFALGEAQSAVLGALEETAREEGHDLALLCSYEAETSETFIHSKVVIVDDVFLAIGSANLTERSMAIDSELALIWRSSGDHELEGDIRRLRLSLLAEHAGRSPEELKSAEDVLVLVRAWIGEGSTRLHLCHYRAVTPNALKTLIFDPGAPVLLSDAEPPA
jgi:phosphatidylserine/phosphatidylglycerophosphate/cardiolipin synthase-like enzyme